MPVHANDKPVTANAIRYLESNYKIVVNGWRAGACIEGREHPCGLAVDAMTTDRGKGDAITGWALLHPDLKYVIWQRRIMYPGGRDEAYRGASPHTDHVHISFKGTGPAGSPTIDMQGQADALAAQGAGAEWANLLGPLKQIYDAIKGIYDVLGTIGKAFAFLTDPKNWWRIALFVLGLMIGLVGVVKLNAPGQAAATKVVKTAVKAVK
jgi:hypothetical protein